MRYKGKITGWKDDKGFGFVVAKNSADKVFVHIRAFANRARRPVDGDEVSYERELDELRRPQATYVKYAQEIISRPVNAKEVFGRVFAGVFCLVLLALLALDKIPVSVVAPYGLLGLVTFAAYAWDKSAARNNRWRTQESTLHMLSLRGGWLGALLAQQSLRHKSSKQEFQAMFWTTVVLNCGVLGWLVWNDYLMWVERVVGF